MAEHFRANNVRAILDLGFAKYRPLEEMRGAARLRLRDRAGAPRRHPRPLDPHRSGARRPRRGQGAAALHRQAHRLSGLCDLGLAVAAGERSRLRSLLQAVHRGRHSGADLRRHHGARRRPAGRRRRHPRRLPSAPSRSGGGAHPELKIVAARPGWPWQAEVIAVLMHKRNIWYELHGWSPKYHTPDLKHEIPRRLKDRVLFGGDYPLFSYERLVATGGRKATPGGDPAQGLPSERRAVSRRDGRD